MSDYTGEIPGSLFMALQTYIWDNQSDKSAGGDTSGDIDAGGFANRDTYETYLGYLDWLLAQKAKEDAEYQQQIEDYAAKGIIAAVVEDESGKMGGLCQIQHVRPPEFFSHTMRPQIARIGKALPRKNRIIRPAGDADITLKKVIAGTNTHGLDGAVFNIYRDGQIVGSDVTKTAALSR